MILETLAARFGLKVGKGVVTALAVAALLAIAGLGFWRGMAAIDSLVEDARAAAIAGRDAHWQAEIERANAEVQKRTAEQAITALAASAAAEAEITRLQSQLTELETRNAALPDGGARGLGRDRVRLLITP